LNHLRHRLICIIEHLEDVSNEVRAVLVAHAEQEQVNDIVRPSTFPTTPAPALLDIDEELVLDFEALDRGTLKDTK
jgi:hypothetical protein